jgi:hypothetical protein
MAMSQRPFHAASYCLACAILSLAVAFVSDSKGEEKKQADSPIFKDVSAQSGIKFAYRNGEEANHLSPLESLGGGIGLIDFDGDGLLDIIIPGGGYFEKTAKELGPKYDKEARLIPNRACEILGHPCKLYKNLGNFKFKDVTEEVIQLQGKWPYSHGVAVGDYDNDGWPDVLITGYGRLVLLHNEPDPKDRTRRKLVDVTDKAGLTVKGWSSSAAWADLDGDGFADLFVVYYTDWSFAKHPDISYDAKTLDVGPPKAFHGVSDRLFRNNRNGTFTDVSKEAGLKQGGRDSDKGVGVLIVDLNNDGKPDVFVTNDTVDNYLYFNQSTPGKFKLMERGLAARTARDAKGECNGNKAIDAADYNGNGVASLFVTCYEGEHHALYENEWRPGTDMLRHTFAYRTTPSGIAALDDGYVGWGTGFVDLLHRGWEDLVIIHGHMIRYPFPPMMPRQQRAVLLRNEGNSTFKEITKEGGTFFQQKHHARGLALGDLDNDGKVDAVVSNINNPISILRNVADTGNNHWLGIELIGKNRRDVVGARISLDVAGRTQWRFAKGGGSFASTRDPRHVFGLGEEKKVGRLTVYWPNGDKQHFDGLKIDRYHPLTQRDPTPSK